MAVTENYLIVCPMVMSAGSVKMYVSNSAAISKDIGAASLEIVTMGHRFAR